MKTIKIKISDILSNVVKIYCLSILISFILVVAGATFNDKILFDRSITYFIINFILFLFGVATYNILCEDEENMYSSKYAYEIHRSKLDCTIMYVRIAETNKKVGYLTIKPDHDKRNTYKFEATGRPFAGTLLRFCGYGDTEQEAINDLIEKYKEWVYETKYKYH